MMHFSRTALCMRRRHSRSAGCINGAAAAPWRAVVHSAIAVAGASVLTACAGMNGTGSEQSVSIGTDCLMTALARDFRYLDDRNLIVYGGPGRQAYHLELGGVCQGLRGDFNIELRSRSDRMCGFAGDSLVVDGAFRERCPVFGVHRLDEDQLAALLLEFEQDGLADEAEVEVEIVSVPAAEDDDSESPAGEPPSSEDD